MSSVSIVNVGKQYGSHQVLSGLNLEIADGEFAVLVGPSGCGKTTTLNMIAGLEEISEGHLFIGGKDVSDLPPKDRDIAMVFQSYALFPHMTVRDNIAFGLKLRRTARDVIDRQINDVAARLQIDHYLDRYPKALSGGQRQRVALGRALVRRPGVFLMDEPLSNLDAKLRIEARSFLSRMHKDLGVTTVYVTHDQAEAMTMGSRIVAMNNGKIQQAAPPLELYNHPANKFVAGFIGSPAMNFIELTFTGKSLVDPSLGVDVAVLNQHLKQLSPYKHKKVIVGIRPEHFLTSGDKTAAMSMSVEVVQHLGHEVLLDLALGFNRLIARVHPSNTNLAGDKITLFLDRDHIQYFDASTEKNVLLEQES